MAMPPSDVLDTVFGDEPPAPDPVAMVRAIAPIASELETALRAVVLDDLTSSTPEQRGNLVALRQVLDAVARDASTMRDAIDGAFRGAAARTGAKQITAGDAGVVRVEQRGEWKVDVAAMRSALEELAAAGQITSAEIGQVFSTHIEEKADNRKLNYLAENRGEEVQLVIDAHRTHIINPMSARLTYAKPSPSER